MSKTIVQKNQLALGIFLYAWTLAIEDGIFYFELQVSEDEGKPKTINETTLYFRPDNVQLLKTANMIAKIHYEPTAKKEAKAREKEEAEKQKKIEVEAERLAKDRDKAEKKASETEGADKKAGDKDEGEEQKKNED